MKIAIASGKGGTGKTFVSTNLFYTFQSMGISAMLTDCDAEVPNSLLFLSAKRLGITDVHQYRPIIDIERCTFCGRCAEYCSYNALFIAAKLKKIGLLEDLCHGCGACQVACPEGAITESHKEIGTVTTYTIGGKERFVEGRMLAGQPSAVPIIKAAINIAQSYKTDIMIIDAPAGTSCPFIQTVARADYVVLVSEPTPFGLSDLRQSVESLRGMNRPFGVIVNRAGIGDGAIYNYLETEKIPLLAEIPFDKEIAKLYSQGAIASEKLPEIKSIFETLATKLKNHGDSSNQR